MNKTAFTPGKASQELPMGLFIVLLQGALSQFITHKAFSFKMLTKTTLGTLYLAKNKKRFCSFFCNCPSCSCQQGSVHPHGQPRRSRVVAQSFKHAGLLWTDLGFYADFKSGFIVCVSLISSFDTTLKDFCLPPHFELKKPLQSLEILS